MRVMWASPSAAHAPSVMYGYSPEHLDRLAAAESHTYTAEDMCSDPANVRSARWFRDPGLLHDALLSGLPADTRVYYRYGDAQGEGEGEGEGEGYVGGVGVGWSEVLFFRTAPAVGAKGVVRFFVYGDMGDGTLMPEALPVAHRVAQHVEENDFVLHVGDISYGPVSHAFLSSLFSLSPSLSPSLSSLLSLSFFLSSLLLVSPSPAAWRVCCVMCDV